MKDSLLRVIDDLEYMQSEALKLSESEYLSTNKISYWKGAYESYEYAIQEVRKLVDDHAKPNDL